VMRLLISSLISEGFRCCMMLSSSKE